MSIQITREVIEDLGDIKEITVTLEDGNILNICVNDNGVRINSEDRIDVRSDEYGSCHGVVIFTSKDDYLD